MTKRPRRNHAPVFKAKVAQRFDVHPNPMTAPRKKRIESIGTGLAVTFKGAHFPAQGLYEARPTRDTRRRSASGKT